MFPTIQWIKFNEISEEGKRNLVIILQIKEIRRSLWFFSYYDILMNTIAIIREFLSPRTRHFTDSISDDPYGIVSHLKQNWNGRSFRGTSFSIDSYPVLTIHSNLHIICLRSYTITVLTRVGRGPLQRTPNDRITCLSSPTSASTFTPFVHDIIVRCHCSNLKSDTRNLSVTYQNVYLHCINSSKFLQERPTSYFLPELLWFCPLPFWPNFVTCLFTDWVYKIFPVRDPGHVRLSSGRVQETRIWQVSKRKIFTFYWDSFFVSQESKITSKSLKINIELTLQV